MATKKMLALLGAVAGAPPSAFEFAAASKEARAPAPDVDPIVAAYTAASRGPPGSHNTVASYMESKAALELGAEVCEKCAPSENTILNCCSVGASWEGTCGDGLAHTWLAGYSACNGRAQVSAISGAKVIQEKMRANHLTDDDLDPESRRIIQERRVAFEREQEQKKHRKRQARRRATAAATRARETAVALEAELEAHPTKPGAGWLRRDLVGLQKKVAGLSAAEVSLRATGKPKKGVVSKGAVQP